MTPTLTIAEQIRAPVQQELDSLEAELGRALTSEIGLVRAIGRHLVATKGKRVRPTLVLLAAKIGRPDAEAAIRVAQAIELIHTATLLHDDSIDRSHLRRGLPTVNKLWDDQVSVIMGDHLFCRAFRLLHERGLQEVAAVVSEGSDRMTYGEMLQMDLRGRFDISEDAYLDIIRHKTASLFEAACLAGAIVGGLSVDAKSALETYGGHVGTAFQIVDDVLDFVGDVDLMGKPVGNDLRDARVTLPLIVAMRNACAGSAASPDGEDALRACGIGGADFSEVVKFVRRKGGVDYSLSLARTFADRACEAVGRLPQGPAARSLMLLAEHAVERKK